MNNAIFPESTPPPIMLAACSLHLLCDSSFFFYSPHPSIHLSIRAPARWDRCFGTIKVDFMHHGAFHRNGKASGTRERLIEGIFNSCHSYCLHFYVACLLAQLTAPNMVQCRLRLHYLKTKGGDRSVLMEIVLLQRRSSTVLHAGWELTRAQPAQIEHYRSLQKLQRNAAFLHDCDLH